MKMAYGQKGPGTPQSDLAVVVEEVKNTSPLTCRALVDIGFLLPQLCETSHGRAMPSLRLRVCSFWRRFLAAKGVLLVSGVGW